ncbi:hypothetical protein U9M48_040645 [Paspalum notatum var. saurae]|uniref:Uncharacterized protein n=1 Tax=Paspalum notatum var. saurae TaxID=547442 RepID=A0AAQ3XE00_PASNO
MATETPPPEKKKKKKKAPLPKVVTLNKALKLAQTWMDKMSRSEPDEPNDKDFEGRPSSFGNRHHLAVCCAGGLLPCTGYGVTPQHDGHHSGLQGEGLALALVGVGAGLGSTTTLGFIVSFVGVLIGSNLIAAGVLMADSPAAPIGPVVLAAAPRALVGCLRTHHAVAGLLMASSAITAVVAAGELAPVLCFCAFALLLLGLSLVSTKVYSP